MADVVAELERELRAQTLRRWSRRASVLLLAVAAISGVWLWRRWAAPAPPPRYTLSALEQRDVFEVVQSTGTVKPLTEVQVGAQVSGRIVKVQVDFNTKVKKGDLLAEIDPSLFGSQVSQVGAQLEAAKAASKRAEAQLITAKANLTRLRNLVAEKLVSQADLDAAEGNHAVAEAEVEAGKAQISQLVAQLTSARTTLAYSRIYSPIDGVVVNRAVEPGQTVAASFSAPVLFVIAQDLAKMQVLAEIDEADVGKLHEGMLASVVVDAFPGKRFEGKVTQLRYSPNNVQGVVTYSAVVVVDNPALELRPGMTATVSVRTRAAHGVVAAPNAALRFKPQPLREGEKPKLEAPLAAGQGRVYVPAGGTPGDEQVAPVLVTVGANDGVYTEIRPANKGQPALAPGAEVVVEQREEKRKGGLFGR